MKLGSFKMIVLSLVLSASATAQAQINAPADSVSSALATSIGTYIKQSVEKQYAPSSSERKRFQEALSKGIMVTEKERPYYEGLAEGMKLADNLNRLREMGFNVDNKMFVSALEKFMRGDSTGFTAEQADEYLAQCEQRIHQVELDAQQAFLDAQAARDGVVRLPSGLLFETIVEGEGEHPTVDDTVEVLYTGRLADGKIFDQTKGSPAVFPVSRLIKGFTEGLTMMRPGGTYRLFIPAELGYGERGAGRDIPGNAALDFTVELIGIK